VNDIYCISKTDIDFDFLFSSFSIPAAPFQLRTFNLEVQVIRIYCISKRDPDFVFFNFSCCALSASIHHAQHVSNERARLY